jgi:factor associated with neutral sphingomyelinase activation
VIDDVLLPKWATSA